VDSIPTGSIALDARRIVACRAVALIEIYVPESSGKTTPR